MKIVNFFHSPQYIDLKTDGLLQDLGLLRKGLTKVFENPAIYQSIRALE